MTRGLSCGKTRTEAASSHSMTAYSFRQRPESVEFITNSVVMPDRRFAPERLAKYDLP